MLRDTENISKFKVFNLFLYLFKKVMATEIFTRKQKLARTSGPY